MRAASTSLDVRVAAGGGGAAAPWFAAWAASLLRLSVAAPGLGGLDAPAASLFMADSADPDAVAGLRGLAAAAGAAAAAVGRDPPEAAAYLLLHDAGADDGADAATRCEREGGGGEGGRTRARASSLSPAPSPARPQR